MKKLAGVAVVIAAVLVVAGLAVAQQQPQAAGPWGPGMGRGPCWGAAGDQAQGQGWGPGMGRGMMGRRGGRGAWAQGAPASGQAIDEAKAKELATDYVTKSLPGYKVDKVTAFQRPRGTAYQVEVHGPQNEVQYLHINPWGGIRLFPRAF